MTARVGDRIPSVELRRVRGGRVETVSTRELFDAGRAVLFGLPGAFTPTCSDRHLPGFLLEAESLRRAGVQRIACVAVNDAYVMDAWGKARGVAGRVEMLADGNGELARALGMEMDLSAAGFGLRSRRFAMVLDDGVVSYLGVEPGREIGVSGAEAIRAWLRREACPERR